MNPIVETAGGAIVTVRVVPNASRNEVAQLGPDAVRIRLQAPPVEGKANTALAEFLSETLGIKTRQVSIVSGDRSRNKRVAIAGVTPAEIAKRLAAS